MTPATPSPEPPPSARESRLVTTDREPAPAARAYPDRPLGLASTPGTVLDQRSFECGVPNIARIYGALLGGKDHFDADRKVVEEVTRLRPQMVAGAWANRHYLARVVRYLVGECGIRQFLDIGTGLPAVDNTHEIAQRAAGDCKIVYVDNDKLVLSHARALLRSTTPEGVCGYVEADLHQPETIIAQAADTLDFAQPVAVLMLAILHFIADAVGPGEIVAMLASALAPGSYVAISHLTGDFAPEHVAAAIEAYNAQAPVPVIARRHAQVTGLFGGLPLVAPGVVPVTQWRPRKGELAPPADLYAGLARIPHPTTAAGGLA